MKKSVYPKSQNSRRTSESNKNSGKASDQSREQLFFEKFRTILGKSENQQKTLGK